MQHSFLPRIIAEPTQGCVMDDSVRSPPLSSSAPCGRCDCLRSFVGQVPFQFGKASLNLISYLPRGFCLIELVSRHQDAVERELAHTTRNDYDRPRLNLEVFFH
jgi:hypothetical protein